MTAKTKKRPPLAPLAVPEGVAHVHDAHGLQVPLFFVFPSSFKNHIHVTREVDFVPRCAEASERHPILVYAVSPLRVMDQVGVSEISCDEWSEMHPIRTCLRIVGSMVLIHDVCELLKSRWCVLRTVREVVPDDHQESVCPEAACL